MSKSKEDIIIQKTVEALLSDIENIQGFIAQEIVKYAAINNNGNVPLVTDKDFQSQMDSLLNADPTDPKNKGKAVLSFKATEQGIAEKIKKLKEHGVSEQILENVENSIKKARENFTRTLSSNEGIEKIVSKRLVSQLLLNSANFMVIDEKTNERRFFTMDEKKNFIKTLEQYVNIAGFALKAFIDSGPKIASENKSIIQKRAFECFGTRLEGSNGIVILDKDKLKDPSVLKTFNEITSFDIKERGASYELANSIIENSFKTLGSQYNHRVTDATKNKIKTALVNDLTKFGPDYLKENQNKLSEEIAKSYNQQKDLLSYFTKYLRISDSSISKITSKINLIYTDKAKEFDYKKNIESKIYSLSLKDSQIAHKLNVLYKETPSSFPKELEVIMKKEDGIKPTEVKVISNKQFAEIRKNNTYLFDKIISRTTDKIEVVSKLNNDTLKPKKSNVEKYSEQGASQKNKISEIIKKEKHDTLAKKISSEASVTREKKI